MTFITIKGIASNAAMPKPIVVMPQNVQQSGVRFIIELTAKGDKSKIS